MMQGAQEDVDYRVFRVTVHVRTRLWMIPGKHGRMSGISHILPKFPHFACKALSSCSVRALWKDCACGFVHMLCFILVQSG